MIRLKLHDYWSYHFGLSTCVDIPEIDRLCSYCGEVKLDRIYTYIINSLKKAGLLDKTYGLICCYCFILEKIGIMQHVHNVEGVYYTKSNDILEVEISVFEKINGEEKAHIIPYRVHDWSKVERWKKRLK